MFEYEVTDMFLLFVKPTIYFSMIFSVWVLIYLFSKAVKSHASVGYKILFIFLAVLISTIGIVAFRIMVRFISMFALDNERKKNKNHINIIIFGA